MDWVNQTIRTTADTKVCESKLYKKDNNCWYLDVIVEKDIPEKLHYQNVIGIDMGIRHIATYVELANGLTKFCGKDLNRVRGHYFWLRRKLGIKKAIDTMKKIGCHEKRIANDIIHNISRDIVNQAIKTNAIIVLGDIKHLRRRKQNTRGRKCYQKGARKIQGLFTCVTCGEENADRNAAFNIAYRALGNISKVGATVNTLRTFPSVDRNAMMRREAR